MKKLFTLFALLGFFGIFSSKAVTLTVKVNDESLLESLQQGYPGSGTDITLSNGEGEWTADWLLITPAEGCSIESVTVLSSDGQDTGKTLTPTDSNMGNTSYVKQDGLSNGQIVSITLTSGEAPKTIYTFTGPDYLVFTTSDNQNISYQDGKYEVVADPGSFGFTFTISINSANINAYRITKLTYGDNNSYTTGLPGSSVTIQPAVRFNDYKQDMEFNVETEGYSTITLNFSGTDIDNAGELVNVTRVDTPATPSPSNVTIENNTATVYDNVSSVNFNISIKDSDAYEFDTYTCTNSKVSFMLIDETNSTQYPESALGDLVVVVSTMLSENAVVNITLKEKVIVPPLTDTEIPVEFTLPEDAEDLVSSISYNNGEETVSITVSDATDLDDFVITVLTSNEIVNENMTEVTLSLNFTSEVKSIEATYTVAPEESDDNVATQDDEVLTPIAAVTTVAADGLSGTITLPLTALQANVSFTLETGVTAFDFTVVCEDYENLIVTNLTLSEQEDFVYELTGESTTLTIDESTVEGQRISFSAAEGYEIESVKLNDVELSDWSYITPSEGDVYEVVIVETEEEEPEGPTVGVNSIFIDGQNTVVYNIHGMRINNVENLQPGIYIVNGKKVVVRK